MSNLKTKEMRVINVVKIKNGVVDNINSYGVVEEQLASDVVDEATKDFLNTAKELGADINDESIEEQILDNGYYENINHIEEIEESVCITWSSVENIQI